MTGWRSSSTYVVGCVHALIKARLLGTACCTRRKLGSLRCSGTPQPPVLAAAGSSPLRILRAQVRDPSLRGRPVGVTQKYLVVRSWLRT